MSDKTDKGKMDGSCNRTACQAPLYAEPMHQFMDGNFTGRGRLYYCRVCSWEFDKWDRIDRPGEPMRIERESKKPLAADDTTGPREDGQ